MFFDAGAIAVPVPIRFYFNSRAGQAFPHCKGNLPSLRANFECGAVAQLVERIVRNDEVRGSIPLSSTIAFGIPR